MLTAARALFARVRTMLASRHGTTAIEYVVVAAGVALAISVAVVTVGQNVLNSWYNQIAAALH